MRPLYVLILSAVIVVGCASTDASLEKTQLHNATRCCKTIAEAEFGLLPPNADYSVSVSADDPVFEFSSGPSHFKAYVLPLGTHKSSRRLYVRSPEPLLSTMFGSPTPVHYFIPAVEFLSEDKQPISEPLDGSLDRCEYSACRGLLLSVAVPELAHFVVVYTPLASLGSERIDDYSRANGITVPLGQTLMTINGGSSPRVSIGSSTGEVRVWVIQ